MLTNVNVRNRNQKSANNSWNTKLENSVMGRKNENGYSTPDEDGYSTPGADEDGYSARDVDDNGYCTPGVDDNGYEKVMSAIEKTLQSSLHEEYYEVKHDISNRRYSDNIHDAVIYEYDPKADINIYFGQNKSNNAKENGEDSDESSHQSIYIEINSNTINNNNNHNFMNRELPPQPCRKKPAPVLPTSPRSSARSLPTSPQSSARSLPTSPQPRTSQSFNFKENSSKDEEERSRLINEDICRSLVKNYKKNSLPTFPEGKRRQPPPILTNGQSPTLPCRKPVSLPATPTSTECNERNNAFSFNSSDINRTITLENNVMFTAGSNTQSFRNTDVNYQLTSSTLPSHGISRINSAHYQRNTIQVNS
eukprot:Pgem_evm1s16645